MYHLVYELVKVKLGEGKISIRDRISPWFHFLRPLGSFTSPEMSVGWALGPSSLVVAEGGAESAAESVAAGVAAESSTESVGVAASELGLSVAVALSVGVGTSVAVAVESSTESVADGSETVPSAGGLMSVLLVVPGTQEQVETSGVLPRGQVPSIELVSRKNKS